MCKLPYSEIERFRDGELSFWCSSTDPPGEAQSSGDDMSGIESPSAEPVSVSVTSPHRKGEVDRFEIMASTLSSDRLLRKLRSSRGAQEGRSA